MTVHIAEDAAATGAVVLEVEGMTCGSCATRIERRLGKLPGVEATVNYATGRARVHGGEVGELVATVEKLGFRVRPVDAPAPTAVPAPRSGASAPSVPATAGPAETSASVAAPAPAPTLTTSTTAGPAAAPAAASPVTEPEPEPEGDRELGELRHRALVCLVLTVPVVAVAMNPDWQFRYWQWFSLMLTAPVVVWGGWRFHRAALRNLRHATATMDTLVSLGTLAAFGWSVVTLFLGDAGLGGMRHGLSLVPFVDPYQGARTIYLETAAAVTTALLAGRWIELRGRRRGLATMRGLLDLRVPDAVLTLGGREIRVPVDRVAVGDEVVVAAGEAVPVDGVVAGPAGAPDHVAPAHATTGAAAGAAPTGHTAVDASAMTGESLPVDVVPGDEVLAGSRVVAGRLVLRAVRVGGETQWARMARRVEEAQTGKARAQRLADRVSSWFVPTVVVLALATLGFWWSAGSSAAFAFTAAVSVLIVACPCALGLATPAALMVGTGRGAQLGILLRGPEVLEQTRAVDTVVLDKTGTVTTGRMHLAAVTTGAGVDEDDLLRRAGALEDAVAHPIARAVAAGARERVGELADAADVVVVDGLGAHGVVDGSRVLVGRPRLLADHGATVPDDLVADHAAAEAGGATAVLVAWADAGDTNTSVPDGAGDRADTTVAGLRARGVLAVTDTVREGAAEAVTRMRALGLRPVLLTGDNPTVAHAVAAEVGIAADDVVAGVLPVDKAAVIDRLRTEGATVAMVGDGVNDAAALAGADLGVAMGTGADVAIEAGDVTLLRDDLRAVPDALRLARRTLAVIRTNLFWAFAYNVAALPLAALGLLNPMIAGVAMAASSIVVVSNSLRLRRFRPLTGTAG